jgi:hypothetical protein
MKLLLLTALTGCMPYVLPPVTADVGPSRSSERGSRTNLHVNVGYSPLHFSRATARHFDATVGGSYDREAGDSIWGVSASAGPVFRPWPHAPSVDRILPQLVGRWTTEGTAVGVRIALERATFAEFENSSSGNSVSSSYGEAAIGFYLETDLRFRDEREWMVTVGLTLRIPATAGVACCMKL